MSVMFMDWWDVLKAPLYYREEPDPALAAYRQRTGMPEPQGAIMRVSEGGPTEEVPRSVTPDIAQSPQNPNPFGLTRLNNPRLKGSPLGDGRKRIFGDDFTHFYESPDGQVRAGIRQVEDSNVYLVDHYGVQKKGRESGRGRRGLNELREVLEQHHGGPVVMRPTNMLDESLGFWDKMLEERVVDNPNLVEKEAKSPKALRHKREYETRYESSPERKRYRRDLERERRKRGVAGKGGKDMSHTKRGTIVPEDPHTNRARSHPSVGSTLKAIPEKFSDLVEVHHPIYDAPLEYDMEGQPKERLREPLEFGDKCRYCEEGRQLITAEGAIGCSDEECYANTPEALQSSYGHSGNIHNPLPAARLNEVGGREGLVDHYTAGSVQADPTVRIDMTPRGPEALQPRQRPIVAHGRNVPNYDTSGYFTTGDPMDLSFRMLKNETRQTKLPQELTAGAHEAPMFARQREAMERKRKQDEAAQRQRLTDQARAAGKSIPLHAFAAQTPAPEDSQRPE